MIPSIIYYADKNVNNIENVLNNEIKKLESYFYENELVLISKRKN